MDISPKVWNPQDSIHRPYEVQKKEHQSVGTSVLLSRGNKTLIEGNIKTNYGAETEDMDSSHKESPNLYAIVNA